MWVPGPYERVNTNRENDIGGSTVQQDARALVLTATPERSMMFHVKHHLCNRRLEVEFVTVFTTINIKTASQCISS